VHDWLEGRGKKLRLIAMIDDATSRVAGRFVAHDSTEENLQLLGSYVESQGRPIAVYTDKASLFQTAPKAVHHREAPAQQPTQIGRALQELNIEWIAAHSPQAKGPVERFFGTAQDRLVKGLRKHQACTLEQANRYLSQHFLPLWNRRFVCEPRAPGNAHRGLEPGTDLNSILSRVETRRIAQDYTLRWDRAVYQIRRANIGGGMRGAKVAMEQRRDGTMWMRWRQRRIQVQLCVSPAPRNYHPAAVPQPKPDPARARQRLLEGRRKWAEAFDRAHAPELWQILDSE
jgi:hypothetical protein